MRGEGTAGQVALLRRWHPLANPLLLSLPPLVTSPAGQGFGVFRGSWSQSLSTQINNLKRGRNEGFTQSRGRDRTEVSVAALSVKARHQRDRA